MLSQEGTEEAALSRLPGRNGAPGQEKFNHPGILNSYWRAQNVPVRRDIWPARGKCFLILSHIFVFMYPSTEIFVHDVLLGRVFGRFKSWCKNHQELDWFSSNRPFILSIMRGYSKKTEFPASRIARKWYPWLIQLCYRSMYRLEKSAMTKATDPGMEIQGLIASGRKFFQTDSSSKLGPVPNRRVNSSTQFIQSLLPSHTQTSQNCRTCRK